MKLTFRLKLFLYFVAIILFTSIPIALITYNHIYNSLKNDLNSCTKAQMVQIDNTIYSEIKQMKEDVSFLATSADIKKADQSISALFNIPDIELHKKYSKQIPGIESTIYNYLEAYGTTHPQTTYVYIGTKWGGYTRWPDGLGLDASKFDPRERPWYSLALDNPDQAIITAPYVSAIDTSKILITVSSTVKNTSGEIVGAVGIDVSLEKLSEMIRDIRIGDTGYIFLFSKDGKILAYPNTNLNFKNISQLDELSYTSTKIDDSSKHSVENYNKFIDEDNDNFETIINGAPVLVNVYTSPDTGWKMASVIQKSELMNRTNKIGYFITFITFCVLLVAIGFTIILTKKITKPIAELTPLMNAAGNGDLEVQSNINSNDEFGELGNSFNLMISKLSSNYEELSAVNEELLSTEEELREQYNELLCNEEAFKK